MSQPPTVRMSYRNRRQALAAWRASVRDAAVVTLAQSGQPMPIAVLAAAIGVDSGALFGLLAGDTSKRFRMTLENVPRDGWWGTKVIRAVGLTHLPHLPHPARVSQEHAGK